MTFEEILDQSVAMLKRRGQATYRTLKRQFDLDDEALEDLKEELVYSYPVADDAGRGLIWTGDPASSDAEAQHGPEADKQLYTILRAVTALLRQEERVTYQELRQIFGFDDAFLNALCEELRFKHLARDEGGKGLVWTGEPQAVDATSAEPSELDATNTTNDATTTDATQDDPIIPSESTPITPDAERRQLTVMFCDLADSTRLSSQLDPEDLRDVIRAYQSTCAEIIERYDGYIAQHLGDGLLIYFGWPRAHEDDAQRALHAGLGIVEAITDSLNPRLQQEKGVQLTVRLGIHTGPVVVGEMGAGERMENLATGETVNIAARLEGLAQPHTVVISNVTARLLRDTFELKDLGAHELKGVAEPMPVFRVLGAAEVHQGEDEHMPDGGVFMVGRDEEVGLLMRRWEQAKEGLGQVVMISGEAGIGKSSLVAMMRHHVVQEGYTRITFRCSPYHTNSALYPLITHLEQVLGFDRGDSSEVRLDKLEQTLRTTSLPLEETVPLLATLLSVPFENRYAALALSPQQQRQQTLDTLVAWLMEESEKQPVSAVWEDLHWADPSTLEMLGLMVDQSPTAAMLNLLTFRPEFEPPWSTRSHMTPITLNRLERIQVEAMISHLASGKALPAEVVEHIVAKTDGVPLYVEELTKMLLDSDLLRAEADQVVLTGSLTAISIPDTLQDSLMARLDQLHQAKEVAQLGAILGREFAYEMLQAVAPQDEQTLQEALTQLVAAELLYQRGRPPRSRYLFKHALIQDAAYQSLLRSTRQQVHQRIAQVYEVNVPETVESQPELVAYHYTEAGCHESAMAYWQRAGRRANERSAYPEAVACFDQVLHALQALPESRDTMQQAVDLCIQLRHALFALREFERLLEVLREAETLAETLADSYRLGLVTTYLGHYYWIAGEPTQAATLGQRAVDIASGLEHFDLQVLATDYLGQFLHSLGNYEAVKRLLTKVMASVEGDLRHEFLGMGLLPSVHSRVWLAWTLAEMGMFSEAMIYGEEGLRIVEAINHPYTHNHACFGLGFVYLRQGAFPKAIPVLEHGHTISQTYLSVASPVNEAHLGYALALSGQTSEAVLILEDAVAQAVKTRLFFYHSLWVAWLSEAYLLAGNLERAHELALEALELSRNRKEQGHQAWALRLLGEIFRQRCAPGVEQAEAHYQQALSLANELGMRPLQAHCHRGLGTLYIQTGQAEQARAELSTAIDMYRDMEMTFWLPETEAALSAVEKR